MTFRHTLLAAACTLGPGLLWAAAPQDPRIAPLLAELGKARHIDATALSPDGRHLAWVVDDNGRSTIQLADIEGRHVQTLTAAKGSDHCAEKGIAWSPDSSTLAFLSRCGDPGHRQDDIYTVKIDQPAIAHRWTHLQGYAAHLSWAPDGHHIGFLYVPGATRVASALAAAKPAEGEIGVDGLEIQQVMELDTRDGSAHALTTADDYAYEFSWAPDSHSIAYTAAPPPGDNNWWVARLYTIGTAPGSQPRQIVDPAIDPSSLHGLQIALPRWSPDGRRLAFIGGLMSDQGFTGGDIYEVASQGGPVLDIMAGSHVTANWFQWQGEHKWVVDAMVDGHAQLSSAIQDGHGQLQLRPWFTLPATIGDGSAVGAVSLSANLHHVAFVQSDYSHAWEIHAGTLDKTPPPAVTHFNADRRPAWGPARSVEWDHEGYHVQGWLLYPADYDPAKRYPMVVSIHGGPSGAVLPSWPGVGYGAAPLAALGYFVFMPNPRGSYGEGEAFVQANRRDFGYGDLRDILAGVDTVEKLVPVDDQRLGVTGWSYGGYSTMFAVTQTHRFKAAVAGAGIANWQSYYGENLIDQWMKPFFGATVYDDPAIYAKSSPISFIKQVTTPTLVLVGDRDAECPAPQSFEFWHALRALKVPTSLVVYPGEGHHFVNPQHQRDVLQRALEWFQRYLPASH
ncbi:S9 family peptidase [Frateuria aurantia]